MDNRTGHGIAGVPSAALVSACLLSSAVLLALSGFAFYAGVWQLGIIQGACGAVSILAYSQLYFERASAVAASDAP